MLGDVLDSGVAAPGTHQRCHGPGPSGEAAAKQWGLPWLTPMIGGLIVIGIMGQFGAWIGGSARLAFSIGIDRYLPPAFGKLHPRWHTPHLALLTMGALSTVFLILMQFGETLRTGYQLLVDMTVVSYFIPFVYLFAAAWKHGYRWSGASGLAVSLAGIGFSFVPSRRNAICVVIRIEDAGKHGCSGRERVAVLRARTTQACYSGRACCASWRRRIHSAEMTAQPMIDPRWA